MQAEEVARICHQTNKAYCESTGDLSQKDWQDSPEWQRKSAIDGVNFHLEALASGEVRPPSASHDSWLAEKKATGWKYGEFKDPDKLEHPCMVPFEELPAQQRAKDHLFGAIVKALFDAGMIEKAAAA